jgi:hypothetical protein
MGELYGRWLLEADDLHALRVGCTKNMMDRAILTGSVQSLQHDQQRALGFSIRGRLQFPEPIRLIRYLRSGLIGIRIVQRRGRIVLEPQAFVQGYPKALVKRHNGLPRRSDLGRNRSAAFSDR